MKRYEVVFELFTGEEVTIFVHEECPIKAIEQVEEVYKKKESKRLFVVKSLREVGKLKKRGNKK